MSSVQIFDLPTAFQADIWAEDQRHPNDPQFTVALRVDLPKSANPDDLAHVAQSVLRDLTAHGQSFHNRLGVLELQQKMLSPEVHQHSFDDAGEVESFFDQWAQRKWDIARAPLIEAAIAVSDAGVVVFLRSHHIVADAWALNLVLRRILGRYRCEGTDATDRNAVAPFAFAGKSAADAQTALDEVLREVCDTSPTLFPRESTAAQASFHRQAFTISAQEVARNRALGLSPFYTVSAALAVLLSSVHTGRYLIGIPFLNRSYAEIDSITQRSNILPVEFSAGGSDTPRSIVTNLKHRVDFLKDRQTVSLGSVVSALGRPAEHRKLFDVTLSYMRYPNLPFQDELLGPPRNVANAHLTDTIAIHLHTYGDNADVAGEICLNLAAFPSREAAHNFSAALIDLVERVGDVIDLPIQQIPIAPAAQREDLRRFEDGPVKAYAERQTVMSLFAQQASQTPDRLAVRNHDGRELSYRELDEWSSAIAHALDERGIGSGDIVAIAKERSLGMMAAIFGILKAGAAYLPVDSEYPEERARYMLEDSGAKAVITDLAGIVPLDDPRRLDPACAQQAFSDLPLFSIRARAEDPAYVIYTSGSTGRPKGVVIDHHSVVNRLEWMQQIHPLSLDDVILQKTPISFDVSVWELFWWAMYGASVALPRQGAQRDPREIIRAIGDMNATVAHFVPSMFEAYIQALADDRPALDAIRGLKCVFASGEALSPTTVNRYRHVYDNRTAPRLINLYGPTEATVDVTFHEVLLTEGEIRSVPIGVPINNTSMKIVAPNGARVPIGMPGELLIGGVQLARGYLNRPELTAERFIFDPHDDGKRWYKTGDLAAWNERGEILYLGRIDGQVKIRGNRIELGEVKSALNAHPEVNHAEVILMEDELRGKHLVGIYTGLRTIAESSLRKALAASLPAAMIPARFVRMDAIPLTPNGKFDRAKASEQARVDNALPPTPALEGSMQVVSEVWQRILHRGDIRAEDDFYSLGGDSILMLRVRSELEAAGFAVGLTELAQHTTVAGLAGALDALDRNAKALVAPLPPFALTPKGSSLPNRVEDAYPASHLQLGLIYHSREVEGSRLYRDVFRYTIKAPWSEDKFRLALAAVIRRHPALRTTFNLSDYQVPLQIVHASGQVDDAFDISQPSNETYEPEIGEYIEAWTRRSYNFEHGPLFHFNVFVQAGSDTIDILFSFHHAILDGGSVANLMRELLLAYAMGGDQATLRDDFDVLPNPSVFVAEELDAIASEEHRSYWAGYLANAPVSTPVGRAQFADPPATGRFSYKFSIDPHLDAALQDFARTSNIQLKSLFLTAHSYVVGVTSGSDEVVTGVVTHARPDIRHSEKLLGLFLNTLPTRVALGQPSWRAMARSVDDAGKRNHPFRRLPLGEIQTVANASPVQTAFNFIHFHVLEDVKIEGGIEIVRFEPREETNFALLVNVMRDYAGGQTEIRIDLDGSVYAVEQGEELASIFRTALERIAYTPDSAAFLNQPLEQAGRVVPSLGAEQWTAVSDLMRQNVKRTPSALALVEGDDNWTYQQLWDASSRIASQLRDEGVAKGDIVGVALPRSFNQIATVVAIFRSGAACLPIDVSYPSDRIELIVGIAEPSVIVTSPSTVSLASNHRHIMIDDAAISAGAEFEDADLTPDDLAYILFTSGSTGVPKGVAMPHRGLSNLVAWQNGTSSGVKAASTLQFAPLSFDVSFQEIASTLAAGGRLHVTDDTVRSDPSALLRLLDQEEIERVFLPFIALQQIADAAITLEIFPKRLNVVVSSGEQLRVTPEIRAFFARLNGAILENQYGPTETHVVTYNSLSGDPAGFPSFPAIGTPITDVSLAVLDRDYHVLPAGSPGEICVFGKALACGYYRSPEQSREKFVSHADAPGGVFYRTGDRGVQTGRGDFISLGRIDAQVKVRGYRVEPSEIELNILHFFAEKGATIEVAVVARQRDSFDSYLAAFMVGNGTSVSLEEVRAHLAATLPAYMVPTYIGWIDALPKTPSGKRDDSKLRELDLGRAAEGDRRAPADERERELCEMVAGLLKIGSVNPDQNIFEQGATSLTAMRIAVLVEKRYGINVPLSAFVRAPTVAQLAAITRDETSTCEFDPLVPLRTTGSRVPIFLVHPMGGNILAYLRVLPHLTAEQPLYALQASGVDAGSVPIATIEEQARFYIARMKQVQPVGPYVIGGWSYGGFVAFEMARQLLEAGDAISNVLILDTMALSAFAHGKANDDELLTWFFWELLWTSRGSSLPVHAVPAERKTLQERFDYIADQAIDSGAIPRGSTKAVIQRLFEVYRANWNAATRYDPGILPIDITLFRAEEPLPLVLRDMHDTIRSEYNDPRNGWSRKTSGRLEVIKVGGDHLSMMDEPFVGEMTSSIMEVIARAGGSNND